MMRCAAAGLVLAALAPFAAHADEIGVKIPTRQGVTETFVYVAPATIKAAAILFPGGEGAIGIKGEGPSARIKSPGNFLIRTRDLFAAQGIAVAALDVPSDHDDGINEGFRDSSDHVEDIAAVVAWLKQKTSAPVWLIGTSMGTISAANGAVRLGNKIDGLVLTSTVTNPGGKHSTSRGVLGFDLGKVVVPVLVMDHVNEACPASPGDAVPTIAATFTASPRVATKMMEGGNSPKSGPCEPFSYHGYFGVEDQAVSAIAGFILAK